MGASPYEEVARQRRCARLPVSGISRTTLSGTLARPGLVWATPTPLRWQRWREVFQVAPLRQSGTEEMKMNRTGSRPEVPSHSRARASAQASHQG